MRKKLSRRYRSTKKTDSGATQPEPTPQPAKYYYQIIDCPLRAFIACSVDGNLSALVQEGYPDAETLQAAWLNIREQYAEAIGDDEYMMFWNLQKEVTLLGITFNQVETIVKLLEQHYVPDFAAELDKLLSTRLNLEPGDNYIKTLKRALSMNKTHLVRYDMKNARLEAMKAKHGDSKDTREHYYSTLITLSNYAKFDINDSITVFQYAERIKQYNQYCKMMSEHAK